MEDYSESSSMRMERENNMMMQEQQPEPEEDLTNNSSDIDSSNNSLAAFDSEIRRMTRDADKILNDIRLEGTTSIKQQQQQRGPAVNIIRDDDDDNDDDTVGDDASLKGELERLDLVSLEIRKSLDAPQVAEASPWKFPPPPAAVKVVEPPSFVVTNVIVWGLVLYLVVHGSFRLVDSEGYLQLLL